MRLGSVEVAAAGVRAGRFEGEEVTWTCVMCGFISEHAKRCSDCGTSRVDSEYLERMDKLEVENESIEEGSSKARQAGEEQGR